MKRFVVFLTIFAVALFITSATLTAQGRGQTGRPPSVGSTPNPGTRPSSPTNNKPASANKPETTGKAESAGQKDAMGFENYGQYVAAKHVSENLNISLAALKTEMMGSDHLSLGGAIKKLRPDLSSQTIQAETKKAVAAGKKAEAQGRKGPKTTS